MARLAAIAKDCYYPIPPECIDGILKHLKLDKSFHGPEKAFTLLDPCAGDGTAVARLAEGLGISYSNTYCVELNAGRAAAIAETYEGIHVCGDGPCSFFGTRITYQGFSIVYCNPPFDHQLGGGGREEMNFVSRATDLLCQGGILVFVLPANQVHGRPVMCHFLDCNYENLEVYKFPDGYRNFGECVVIGKRRKHYVSDKDFYKIRPRPTLDERGIGEANDYQYLGDKTKSNHLAALGEESPQAWRRGLPVADYPGLKSSRVFRTWEIPATWPPRAFCKIAYTDDELAQELNRSPLYAALKTREEVVIGRPPLPLNSGHTSLLLLSGEILDGYVASDPPHVVRAACGKVERHVRNEHSETAAGTTVDKEIYVQVPNPVVRAVWSDGKIHTFAQKAASKAATEAAVELAEDETPYEEESGE